MLTLGHVDVEISEGPEETFEPSITPFSEIKAGPIGIERLYCQIP